MFRYLAQAPTWQQSRDTCRLPVYGARLFGWTLVNTYKQSVITCKHTFKYMVIEIQEAQEARPMRVQIVW